MFTAEQAAAGAFFSRLKKTRLFQKGVFWFPQARFTAEQVAADTPFLKRCVLGSPSPIYG